MLIAAALAHHRGPSREDQPGEVGPIQDWSPIDDYMAPTVTPPDEVYTPPIGDNGIIDIVDEIEDTIVIKTTPPPDPSPRVLPPGDDPYTSPFSPHEGDKWWVQDRGMPDAIIVETTEQLMDLDYARLDTETVHDVRTDVPTLREAFPILKPFLEKVDIWWEQVTSAPDVDLDPLGYAFERQVYLPKEPE